MRIAIDGRLIERNKSLTGIGRYIYELLKKLDQIENGNEYIIISQNETYKPISEKRCEYVVENISVYKKIKSIPWMLLRQAHFLEEAKAQVFWATNSIFSPLISRNVKIINTVYDFVHKIVPETMRIESRVVYKLLFSRSIRRSNYITTISNGTSEKLLKYENIISDAVIYPGVSDLFVPPDSMIKIIIIKKYKINFPYILALGTLEPRKNIKYLIDEFIKYKNEIKSKEKLILIGGKGWNDKELIDLIKRNDDVVPLGFVQDEDLPTLYACSQVFIFPSIYEGYGIPISEAICCGATVIATDIAEHREAGKEFAFYFNPKVEPLSGILLKNNYRTCNNVGNYEKNTWRDGAEKINKMLSQIG